MIQPILLAAGCSSRFPGNKLLQPLADGTPLALAAARNLVAALPGALAVVTGLDDQLDALLEAAGLRVSACPRAHEGMATSLAWAVAQTREADGWLIALADMPFIAPRTIRRIAQAACGPVCIVAPVYGGQRGHPVAFGHGHGQALVDLRGDGGARVLLQTHHHRVVLLPCSDPGVLRDIDRPEDLAR